MAGGNKCGHVKDRADLRAATEDVALTAELTAVVVKGSDAGEGYDGGQSGVALI